MLIVWIMTQRMDITLEATVVERQGADEVEADRCRLLDHGPVQDQALTRGQDRDPGPLLVQDQGRAQDRTPDRALGAGRVHQEEQNQGDLPHAPVRDQGHILVLLHGHVLDHVLDRTQGNKCLYVKHIIHFYIFHKAFLG